MQDQSLFIVDATTGAWVSLPFNSNGYVIHSPDARMVTAWCGSPDTNYTRMLGCLLCSLLLLDPVLRKPSGEEILCINDKKWDKVKSQFTTWKYWQERNGVLVFSAKDGDAAFTQANYSSNLDTYRVMIDCTVTPAIWRYVSHSGEVPIPHDGVNPCDLSHLTPQAEPTNNSTSELDLF